MKKSSKSSKSDLGNTDSKSPKQSSGCIKYCWTYNNYLNDKLDELNKVLTVLGNWVYGKEVGKEGTPHLQGWIKLKTKMRITEFKKYELLQTIHFEKQNGKDKDAIMYCMKDGIYSSNFDLSEYEPDEELDIISNLSPWQMELENILINPADKRSVYWIWESDGGVGKSSFAKYLCHKHKAVYIDEGKKSDLINIVYNVPKITKKTIIAIDIPRDNINNVSYKAIEQFKNGMICNTKYETGMRLFNSPHVIIFSNFYPEVSKLSSDRWKIAKIDDNKLVWD